jgi:hypothetical protein
LFIKGVVIAGRIEKARGLVRKIIRKKERRSKL